MKFSIVTVCYNSAATIQRTLQSVAHQQHPNIEHILIDGASQDGTLAAIREFGPHVSVLISEPDRGIYDAMNKGLQVASGDVICFLNADDHYTSAQTISRVDALMKMHRLDAVLGDVAYFNESAPDQVVRRYRSDRFTPERLAWGWMPAHPALFLRREVFTRVGNFKTDYRIAGDFEFVVRAFLGKPALRYRHIPEALVAMQNGGISTGGLRAKILLNREVLRACQENGVRTNIFKILAKYPAKLLDVLTSR